MKVFIVTEWFLFLSCFSSFINFRVCVLVWVFWVLCFSCSLSIGLAEIFVLVFSSWLLNGVINFIRISWLRMCTISMQWVSIYGMLFLVLFLYEFCFSLFLFRNYFLNCVFYFTLALHGSHVIIGWVYLVGLWLCCVFYVFSIDFSVIVLLFSFYWHFVDFVFLFVCMLFCI
jgi:heme/copper-type cytochrome/quinol oxidase subunit 3